MFIYNNDRFVARAIHRCDDDVQLSFWKKYKLLISKGKEVAVLDNDNHMVKKIACINCIVRLDYLCITQDSGVTIFDRNIDNQYYFAFRDVDVAAEVHGAFDLGQQCMLAMTLSEGLKVYKVSFDRLSLTSLQLPPFIRAIEHYRVSNLGLIELAGTEADKEIFSVRIYRWKDIFCLHPTEEQRISFKQTSYVASFFSSILVCQQETKNFLAGYNVDRKKQLWSSKGARIIDTNGSYILTSKEVISPHTGETIYYAPEGWTISGITSRNTYMRPIVWLQSMYGNKVTLKDGLRHVIGQYITL